MRRLKIVLAYDGTNYHGWQVQPGVVTVQSVVQAVLSEIEGSPVQVPASGRTDAGVHALAQVAAFNFANPIPPVNLRKAMNRLLPRDIRVLEVTEAAADFHPRYHAKAKTYEYRIWRGELASPFERLYLYHYPYPLNVDAIRSAAPILEGDHDFTVFAASDERDRLGRSKVRTIFSSRAELSGERLIYRVRGSGFLKHMVRNIAGVLLEIGKGNLSEDDLRSRLEPGCAIRPGPSTPARGLFLISVDYLSVP